MDRETTAITKDFTQKILKKYHPAKIILFGSRARGDNLKHSDFDFIIVSRKFRGKLFIFRASDIYPFWRYPFDIEPLCYTPEEFRRKKKQRGIILQAVKDGIELKAE